VRGQLLSADAVLVWVDPIHQGKTRALLDPLLRDVSTRRKVTRNLVMAAHRGRVFDLADAVR
jgi:hypothetical protein